MSKILLSAIFCIACFQVVMGQNASPSPESSSIGLLPSEKIPEVLLPKERNPFALRENKIEIAKNIQESEESQLRTILGKMTVTGVIRGEDDTKALLQNLILKKGQPLPPLLENQSEKLVVTQITENEVELNFREADETATPRKILIPINLQPRVQERAASATSAPQRPLPKGIKVTP